MKRATGLYERIADMENLRLAFWKASRGKSDRSDVREFRLQLGRNLHSLRADLRASCPKVGELHTFLIHDPKERLICAAAFRERVLHHAIMNICHDVFERHQFHDSYASRPGKGAHAAVERARAFCRESSWFLKLDVRHCFDSMDHQAVKERLGRLFAEPRLLGLFAAIIDSYEPSPGRGLPIGHLTSQYFANDLLSEADRFLKEVLRARRHVRYMDDMVVWSDSREWLMSVYSRLSRHLGRELCLELKPPCLHRTSEGLPFLGCVVFPEGTNLAKRSRKRYARKLRTAWLAQLRGTWSQGEFADHVIPLIAFAEHAPESLSFRKRVLAELERSLGVLVPREPGRQLEQQRQQLPRRVPEQERAGQPEQQPGAPARALARSSGNRRMPFDEPGTFRVLRDALAGADGGEYPMPSVPAPSPKATGRGDAERKRTQ